MTTCAVIDANGISVKLIVAEPTDTPPEGCTLMEIPQCNFEVIEYSQQFDTPKDE